MDTANPASFPNSVEPDDLPDPWDYLTLHRVCVSEVVFPSDSEDEEGLEVAVRSNDSWESAFLHAQRESGEIEHDLAQVGYDQAWAEYMLLRDAAERGDLQAQFDFALTLRSQGDCDGFIAWFRRSAEQGFATAQWALGWCYTEGEGVEKDLTQAIKWYRLAAKQGDEGAEDALRRLGA